MKTSEVTKAPEAPLSHDLLYAARYYLGGRKALIALAGLIVVAGGALNWSWLVAVGVAPLLLSVLPCAAMCALGLCMNRMAGKSCSTGKVAADAAAPAEHSPSQALPATVRNVERLRPSHDEPVRPEEYAAGGKAADFVEAPTSDKRR